MKLFNGTRNETIAIHVGLCLTDDTEAARHYGDCLTEVELDLSGLVVEDVDAYDHEANVAPGDTGLATWETRGVDVLRYEDETERSYQHTTYRLVSRRALLAVTARMVAS